VEVAAQRQTLAGRVIGVAFAPPASVAIFERGLDLGVPILCDPTRVAYGVFGFGRRSGWIALIKPRYWLRLLRAIRKGRRLGRVREDPGQLGGDVVVDSDGRLTWVYASQYPADRPSLSAVRTALEEAATRR
jgi:hypothetical protein